MQVVKMHFRPEFLNRLDDIVIFHPLTKGHLHNIVRMQVESINKRLAEKNIKLDIDVPALEVILSQAYDPLYGARPLRRYLEKHIVTQVRFFTHRSILERPSNGFFSYRYHA